MTPNQELDNIFGGEGDESPIRFRLRDSLAHSLEREAYRRPEYEPYRFHWTDVLKFLVGTAMLYLFVIALVVMGSAAQ